MDVAGFTRRALSVFGAQVSGEDPLEVNLAEASTALKDVLAQSTGFDLTHPKFIFRFNQSAGAGELYLQRTHPFIETLANHVLETALDPLSGDTIRYPAARRCGAIRTSAVTIRTTLLLVRFRFHIISIRDNVEKPLLAEDCRLLAFTGSPENAVWLEDSAAESLLLAKADENISPEQASGFISKVAEGYGHLLPHLEDAARQRGEELLDAHQRVRKASKARNVSYRVEPHLPPDVLGIFVYLPIV